MSDIVKAHAQALEATGTIVAGIPPDRWHDATPCPGWDVRALVNHVVSGNLWAAELATGATIEEVGDRFDADLLGADPVGAYAASAQAAGAAFGRPGALDAPCAVSYGPVPGSVYAGHRFFDVFIHGWDLTAATGQDTRLDPALMQPARKSSGRNWRRSAGPVRWPARCQFRPVRAPRRVSWPCSGGPDDAAGQRRAGPRFPCPCVGAAERLPG